MQSGICKSVLLIVVGLLCASCGGVVRLIWATPTPVVWEHPGVSRLNPESGLDLIDPVWSPDGSKLALTPMSYAGEYCTRGRLLFFAPASGEMRVLIEGKKQPCSKFEVEAWSPDGKEIAFWTDDTDPPGVGVVNADGSGQPRLVHQGYTDTAWSPGWTRMAFWERNLHNEGGVWIWVNTVWMVTFETGEKRAVFRYETPYETGFGDFSWSPDGSRLALGIEAETEAMIWVLTPDSGEKQLVFKSTQASIIGAPSWSPDGSRLAFWLSGRARRTGDILILDLATGQVYQLAHGSFSDAPSWSPDGKMIVYTKEVSANGGALVISQWDGSCSVQPLKDLLPISSVAWSPNGRQIAFTAWGNLYVIDLLAVLGEDFLATGPMCP